MRFASIGAPALAAALVAAAEEDRLEDRAFPDVQCSDTLRAVDLVSAQSEQVNTELLHVGRDLAGALDTVGVERNPGVAGQPRDPGNGLNRAQLVVGVHDGDQHGFRAQCLAHVLDGNDSVRTAGEPGDSDAPAFKAAAGVEDGRMLDGTGDDVLGRLAGPVYGAENRQIVRFRAAAREDDLGGLGVQQRRYLPPGALDTRARSLSEGVNARRVAIALLEVGQHGPQHLGGHRRRRVVVEVVAFHGVTVRILIISWVLKSSLWPRTSDMKTTTWA